MQFDLTIDEDIRTAETLPARFYRDPEFHEWARAHIFARSWQLIGDVNIARIPQHVHPFTFLPGCLDEPLMLTRDGDDELHCLSNVCTHRGMLLATQPCRTAHLRCAYHGRRFKLDGTFQHMPEFEKAADFPSQRDDLPGLPIKQWGPLLFTAIDPAFSFEEWIVPIEDGIGWLTLKELVFDPGRSRDYLVQGNWALYCDNYLEGFHIPFVHAALNTALDYGEYATRTFRYANLQLGISSGGEATFDVPESSPDHGRPVAGYYFWLFPNLMLNFYPWGLSINIVKPLAPNRTKVSFLTYVSDESRLEQGAGAALDRVEREDEDVVEAVQLGISSRLYDRGRYSPSREQCVHHFHRLLAEFVNENRRAR
jgi:choline monooxygenase